MHGFLQILNFIRQWLFERNSLKINICLAFNFFPPCLVNAVPRQMFLTFHILMTSLMVNFENIQCAAFTFADPKSTKKTDDLTVFFCTFGILKWKSCTLNVGEINPWWSREDSTCHWFELCYICFLLGPFLPLPHNGANNSFFFAFNPLAIKCTF